MKAQQPRFISVQLHREIGGASASLIYAHWESVQKYRVAREKEYQSAALMETLKKFPKLMFTGAVVQNIDIPILR